MTKVPELDVFKSPKMRGYHKKISYVYSNLAKFSFRPILTPGKSRCMFFVIKFHPPILKKWQQKRFSLFSAKNDVSPMEKEQEANFLSQPEGKNTPMLQSYEFCPLFTSFFRLNQKDPDLRDFLSFCMPT